MEDERSDGRNYGDPTALDEWIANHEYASVMIFLGFWLLFGIAFQFAVGRWHF